MAMDCSDAAMAALTEEWGQDWDLWVSRHKEMFAARRLRYLTDEEIASGLAATLIEDDPDALATQLIEQRDLELRLRHSA
jgi:hypothetical protein